MRTSKLLITLAGAALLLWSCDVKDPIYDTPHPDHGKITLTADWSNIGTNVAKPASYTVKMGDYFTTLSDDVNTLEKLFVPNTYRTYVYNSPTHITIDQTTAKVKEATGNVDGVGKFVESMPDWFFSNAMDIVVEKDKEHSATAILQQQVRELTLILEPTGGTVDKIERIDGWLSGVAGTMDIEGDTHDNPSNVALQFVKGSDGKYRATVRLLGVAGSQQKLTATLAFVGGNPSSQIIDSELNTALTNFNSDKKTPLTLGATVFETPTEFGLSSIISSWELGNGSGETGNAE